VNNSGSASFNLVTVSVLH